MVAKYTPGEPLIVGLTGGIGSGKTVVSNRLAELGATVIDTDAIAHSLTAPGGLAIAPIASQFGQDSIAANGSLNRDWMRALVFSDPTQRAVLEGILHPLIRQEVGRELAKGAPNYFVLVVPLLAEKGGWREIMHDIVVVDCPTNQQVERVVARNGWPEAQVFAVLASQATREQRLAIASEVLENSGLIAQFIEKIDLLHDKFLKKRR